MRPSSAFCLTIRTNSLRRSSVSCGKLRRSTAPSLDGLSPRSDCWMAFSMALERGLVERGDHQRAGLGHAEPGQLLQRDVGAVVLDRQLLDQGRRGPAGADAWRTRRGCGRPWPPSSRRRPRGSCATSSSLIDGARSCGSRSGTGRRNVTKPAYRSPHRRGWTARCPASSGRTPGSGRSLSMHSVMAVLSMTCEAPVEDVEVARARRSWSPSGSSRGSAV